MNTENSIDQNIAQLQRFQYFEIQLSRCLGGWLAGVKGWEIKHEIARHLWEDAQHSRELRTRLWELRKPNPDRGLPETLEASFHQLASAREDAELIAGLYLVFKPALVRAYRDFISATNPVYDAPSLPLLTKIIAEEEAQIAWAQTAVKEMAKTPDLQRKVERWKRFVGEVIDAMGGIAGEGETTPLATLPPGYATSLLPFAEARRDSRFNVQMDAGAAPDPSDRAQKVVWQFFNYAQEMQAAETLGSILWETSPAPWEFYHDVARHLSDEARHCRMGEMRLAELGHSFTEMPSMVGNYAWRQLVDPMRRFAILTYIIEAGSFEYKHRTYEEHLAAGDGESAKAVLYDIIDETMHVRFGKKWLPELVKLSGETLSVDEIVAECREITLRNTLSPEQKRALQAA